MRDAPELKSRDRQFESRVYRLSDKLKVKFKLCRLSLEKKRGRDTIYDTNVSTI